MRKLYPLAAAGVAAIGVTVWLGAGPGAAKAATPASPSPGVPVSTIAAKAQDVPVYLTGLGTVQAFNTVEIKAQVNGTLISIPVREGQEVKKGDIIAEIDPRPYKAVLDQATAQRAEDVAQLKAAQLDLQRFQNLATRSFAPVQQVDDQRATVDKLAAAIQADTAAIETAQINVDFCTIRAPIDGRVSLYQTDVGNLIEVATQTGIVSITQDQPISAVFTLPESELPQVQDAMVSGPPEVVVDTSDGSRQLSTGTLMAPNNTVDTSTGTISLKASFANTDHRLWPGEFVNAQVLVQTLHNAVTVPIEAIQHGPQGLFVYTVESNNTVQIQPISVGYQNATLAVVNKGLQGGEAVVLTGQSRLAPGTRVAVQKAQASATSAADDTGNSAANNG
jgi:membrane fusion protein, multidrug efflux system